MIYKGDVLRYVGFSATDIYKTMYRHFQSWDDMTQKRVVYKNLKDIKVRVVYCAPIQAAKLERALIIKYSPMDNPQKLLNFKIESGEATVFQKFAMINTTSLDDVPF